MKTTKTLTISDQIALKLILGLPQLSVKCEIDLHSTEDHLRCLSPGLGDIQMAQLSRLGHKEGIPQAWNWENILSALEPGEELLWIVSKNEMHFQLNLGIKYNNYVIDELFTTRNRKKRFNSITESFCRRAFPESKVKILNNRSIDLLCDSINDLCNDECTLISGIPSPKNIGSKEIIQSRKEAEKTYSSLNDVLESFLDENQFSIVFSVTRASSVDVKEQIECLNDIRSLISPYLKRQYSKTESEQIGSQAGKVTAISDGDTVQEKRGLWPSIVQSFRGASKDSKGKRRIARSYSHTETVSESETTTSSRTTGQSLAFSVSDSGLIMLDKHLEQLVERMGQCRGTGGYYGSISVHASNSDARKRISNTLIGVLSGSQTHLRPFQQIECTGPDACFNIKYNTSPSEIIDGIAMLNVHQASKLFMLPEAELPGIKLKRNIFYGRASDADSPEYSKQHTIRLGIAAFNESATTKEKDVSLSKNKDREVRIDPKQLLSHMLITGATGSGKTIRSIKLINRLPVQLFRVYIIETAKKVYRNQFCRGSNKPKVYNLGGFDGTPFRINPFYFDKGTSLKRHISVLCDAMSDLLPVEALIGPKLREAVLNCYNSVGWNIETGEFETERKPVYPNMIDFNSEIVKLCKKLGYSSEINENYRGALLGRARIFIDDLYQDTFSHNGNLPFPDQFGEDCIIELADLPPSEINMPAFIISLFLQRLRAWHSIQNDSEVPPYSIVVIEEAHNILSKKLESDKSQYQTGGGKHLVEQVNRLLQEGRELGIGVIVIDQSPRSLADSVLINTNTKLVHRLLDGDEAKTVGKGIGLKPDEWGDIHFLEDGECIVSLKQGGKPHKMAPFRRDELPEIINRKNLKRIIPNYSSGERILTSVAECVTLSELSEKTDSLLSECGGDLMLADYTIGKHLAWNDLITDETNLSESSGKEDIAIKLGEICFSRLDPALEFEKLLICELTGTIYSNKHLADKLFGIGWLCRCVNEFLKEMNELGIDDGMHESVLRSWQDNLLRWSSEYRDSNASSDKDYLRILAKNAENMLLITKVLSQRFYLRLIRNENFLMEIFPLLSASKWKEVHRLLHDEISIYGFIPLEDAISIQLLILIAGFYIEKENQLDYLKSIMVTSLDAYLLQVEGDDND